MRPRGNITKKLTRIEPQSTLRRLVMRPSCRLAGDVEAQRVAELQAEGLREAVLDADAVGLLGLPAAGRQLVVRRQLRRRG